MVDQKSFSRRVLVKSSMLGLLALPIQNLLFAKSIFHSDESDRNEIKEPKRFPAIAEEIANLN